MFPGKVFDITKGIHSPLIYKQLIFNHLVFFTTSPELWFYSPTFSRGLHHGLAGSRAFSTLEAWKCFPTNRSQKRCVKLQGPVGAFLRDLSNDQFRSMIIGIIGLYMDRHISYRWPCFLNLCSHLLANAMRMIHGQ